jgi:hypothetical protein
VAVEAKFRVDSSGLFDIGGMEGIDLDFVVCPADGVELHGHGDCSVVLVFETESAVLFVFGGEDGSRLRLLLRRLVAAGISWRPRCH